MKNKMKTGEKGPAPVAKPAVSKPAGKDSLKYYLALAGILILSGILFSSVIKNGFVWDDTKYIIENELNKSLSWEGITSIFTNTGSHNYAPVTDLINAVQYSISGMSPAAFHTGSLLFHLLNILLVFRFIVLLSGRQTIALIASLFFGIHPIMVESVAWASGSSTLYSTAFFLASLIAYLYYLNKNSKRDLALSIVFFILAMLSKAIAVMLPVVLLLIHHYKDRKITKKSAVELSVFFVLSIIIGIYSIMARDESGVTDRFSSYSFLQRIVFASYGFIMYLVKLIVPVNLSAFYPYPVKSNEVIPLFYYIFPVLFLLLAGLAIYSLRSSRKVFFGVAFFAATLFTVSQIFPVGGTVMADRYIYLSSVGIFYLAGEGFLFLSNRKMWAAMVLTGATSIFFIIKTHERIGVWKSDRTLWDDVIKQYQTIPYAYNNRGLTYVEEKKYNEAISDFSKAVDLKPDYDEAWFNRGLCYVQENRAGEALADFKRSIELKPEDPETYYNCGVLLMNQEKNDEAITYFDKAISLNPDYAEALINRANINQRKGKLEESLLDYNRAVVLEPDNYLPFLNRGMVYSKLQRSIEARADYTKVISLRPDNYQVYNLLGNIFFSEKNYREAITNFSKAISLRSDYADAYFNRGLSEYNLGNRDAAVSDFRLAEKYGSKAATDALRQIN